VASGPAARIGVDLGGTKIEAVALAADGGETFRQRVPTPRDYAGTIAALGAIVAEAEAAVGGTATVGIGSPGSASPRTGLWRNANATFINGRDLVGDLAAALGRPVRVENDANCFALSEALDGAGAGHNLVFGITAGTGIGGGVVVGGRLHRGPNATAGEVGHLHLPWITAEDEPQPPCFCGKRGCVEQYVSGTGLAIDYRKATGESLHGEEIIARAAAGEPAARAALGRLIERFGRFLALITDLLDPDVIVLGGGLSNIEGICGAIADAAPRHSFGGEARPLVVKAVHGGSSGVRGAAMLWDLPG
jgi:fructokinase